MTMQVVQPDRVYEYVDRITGIVAFGVAFFLLIDLWQMLRGKGKYAKRSTKPPRPTTQHIRPRSMERVKAYFSVMFPSFNATKWSMPSKLGHEAPHSDSTKDQQKHTTSNGPAHLPAARQKIYKQVAYSEALDAWFTDYHPFELAVPSDDQQTMPCDRKCISTSTIKTSSIQETQDASNESAFSSYCASVLPEQEQKVIQSLMSRLNDQASFELIIRKVVNVLTKKARWDVLGKLQGIARSKRQVDVIHETTEYCRIGLFVKQSDMVNDMPLFPSIRPLLFILGSSIYPDSSPVKQKALVEILQLLLHPNRSFVEQFERLGGKVLFSILQKSSNQQMAELSTLVS